MSGNIGEVSNEVAGFKEASNEIPEEMSNEIPDFGGTKSEEIANRKYNILVLGPGGAPGGFLEIGALLYLDKKGFLEGVETIVGVSVGAIIGLLYVSGLQLIEIGNLALVNNFFSGLPIAKSFTSLIDGSFGKESDENLSILGLLMNSIQGIIENRGLFPLDHIKDVLKNVIRDRFGFIPTLGQLYMASGIKLEVVSVNVDTSEPAYISHETDPDISCVDAVSFSFSIPFLFYQNFYRGSCFVDGALRDPYPVLRYDSGKNKILGVHVFSEEKEKSDTVLSYIHKLISCITRPLIVEAVKKSSSQVKNISLHKFSQDTIGITLSEKEKLILLLSGYLSAMAQVEAT